MTEDEFRTVCMFMERGWRGDLDHQGTRSTYRTFLDKFPVEVVLAALHRLAETGDDWLPKIPTITKACRDVMREEEDGGEIPSWSEVFQTLHRALCIRVGYFDSDEKKTATAVAWLEQHSHPVVAAFFRAEGGFTAWQQLGLDDEDWGAARREQLHRRWLEFVEVAQARLDAGLSLEAVGRRERLSGPQKLSQAALLDAITAPRPELTPGGASSRPQLASGE